MCTSLVAQTVKNLSAMWETRVWSLGWEDALENGVETHSSILAWRIPWTEEPVRLQSMGSQRVVHDWDTNTHTHTHTHTHTLFLSLSLKEGAFLRMYVFIVLLSTDSEAITIPGRLKSTVLTIIEGCGTSSSRNADCLIYSSWVLLSLLKWGLRSLELVTAKCLFWCLAHVDYLTIGHKDDEDSWTVGFPSIIWGKTTWCIIINWYNLSLVKDKPSSLKKEVNS